MDFSNKTALITGAGQGVGEGIAVALASYGANVSLIGRTLSKVQRVADEINDNGGSAIAIQCDVKDKTSIDNSILSTVSESESSVSIHPVNEVKSKQIVNKNTLFISLD